MIQEIREKHKTRIEINELTGLLNSYSFLLQMEDFLQNKNPDQYCLMTLDLEHFRLFNKLYGRDQGDVLLQEIGRRLQEICDVHNGIAGYMGGDNFAIVVPYDKELLRYIRRVTKEQVMRWSNSVGYLPVYGIYRIDDCSIPVTTMYDRATMAMTNVLGNYSKRSCEYTSDMEEREEEEIRLLTEIQEGLANREFVFFLQPQCDIMHGKIVGAESLVRWKRGNNSIVSPGIFVPVMERNGFISDLDRYIWDLVCEWIRGQLDLGYEPVPISINVSRTDIFSMDVSGYLLELIKKYNLDSHYIKVEITESAYSESSEKIIETVKELRDAGFLVMMDDFGSAYSSLNMLKSIPVDILKIDMRFLEIKETEIIKGIGILESVVNMARQLQIPIVVEGVETQQQENFLLKMGCRYTQGYFYYKPMPIKDFEALMHDERNVDYHGIWNRQTEAVHLREFLDENLFSDVMFNNILGPTAFYDMFDNRIEIARVNAQYYKLIGMENQEEEDYNRKFWNHVRDDDRQLLVSIFAEAYDNPEGASGCIHFLRNDGITIWVYIKVFFLREKDGHRLFFASLTDVTAMEKKRWEDVGIEGNRSDMVPEQQAHIEEYYSSMPCGFGIGRLELDNHGKPLDYEIVYANRELARLSGGDMGRLRYLLFKSFGDKKEEFMEQVYQAAFLGKVVTSRVYSAISHRYLSLTLYQFQYGYVGAMLQDETNSIIHKIVMSNIFMGFREVYYLNIPDNYCRMVYPNEGYLLERGNYEETVNRHFGTGKIKSYDEKAIRNFLSLDNLRKTLSDKDTVGYKYQRSIGGTREEWCQTTITVTERRDGVPIAALITIRSIESLVREKKEKHRQSTAEILSNMVDGFLIYRADAGEKILYANQRLFEIYGCQNVYEFRELVNNSFQGMVHPEDLARVEWEIKEQVQNSGRKMDFIRYRIICKDGSIHWIDDCGHLEDFDTNGDIELFYVTLSDITDTIEEEEKERLIELSRTFAK